MVQIQDKLETRKEHLAHVLQQLAVDYQAAQSERSALAQAYPGDDDDFAFLEELELLTVDISGYANQVKTSGTVKNLDLAIGQLQGLSLLENGAIGRFFADVPAKYPKTQAYIRMLDYLRLLVLEYLQNQS